MFRPTVHLSRLSLSWPAWFYKYGVCCSVADLSCPGAHCWQNQGSAAQLVLPFSHLKTHFPVALSLSVRPLGCQYPQAGQVCAILEQQPQPFPRFLGMLGKKGKKEKRETKYNGFRSSRLQSTQATPLPSCRGYLPISRAPRLAATVWPPS